MSTIQSVTSLNASDMQMDYMNLLVAQLQNQNPLEPLDNNEMASQLAMFSQLQQLESMNTSFSDVLKVVENDYASSLIGKEITFMGSSEFGEVELTSGIVEEVYKGEGNEINLVANGYTVGLDDILSVKN